MELNNIRGKKGSKYVSKRIGRGIGSGKGKTSGKGHKGQGARTGVAINGFEGGQMPIHRRLPKRGFANIHRIESQILNVGELSKLIGTGKIDNKTVISKESLYQSGLISNQHLPLKLLAKGEIEVAVNIEVDAYSASALEKISKAGGTINSQKAA
jgi:large subunit ribosomal protein L15